MSPRCAGSSTSRAGSSSGPGVLVLLFTAYQIWGTSIQESHTQAGCAPSSSRRPTATQIRHALGRGSRRSTSCRPGPRSPRPARRPRPRASPIGDIRIPVIGINQVVVEGTNTPDLRKGPGHYIGTPLPGQSGNAAIAGHRTTYGHPFYNLDSVKVGDPIVLTTLQGIFVYDTTKSFVVSPSDTTVINNVFANHPHPHDLQSALQRLDPAGRPGQAGPLPALPELGPAAPADAARGPEERETWPATPTSSSPTRCSGASSTRGRRARASSTRPGASGASAG